MIEIYYLLETLPAAAWSVLGAGLGLLVGSYLATLLVRWPEGESASFGRSRCDGCNRPLRWFELVPLASYGVLRGRCSRCGARIDPLHTGVEALCGLAGAVLAGLGQPAWMPFAWLLIVLAAFDWLHLWLPNRLTLILAAVALIVPPLEPGIDPVTRMATGAVAFAILWLVAWGYRTLRGREGLGGGDPKLFGAIGLWSGPFALPSILLIACLIGLADAVRRRATKGAAGQTELPLGTYLAAATLATALFAGIASGLAGF